MKNIIPERLKSSKQLQAEVLLAGLALWQFKKEMDRRRDKPEDSDPITPPVNEVSEGVTTYAWPNRFDEAGRPQAIEVGSIEDSGGHFSVHGTIEAAQSFVVDHTSEMSRQRLRSLKKGIDQARASIEERAARFAETHKRP